MVDVAHSTLTGSDLHEMKGAAAASIHTVPVSDGAGATSFAKIDSDNIDTTSIFNTNKYFITFTWDDLSTANTQYLPIPIAGTVTKIWSALEAAITTGDAVFTFSNNADASMGTLTITQSGSGAGDVDSLEPASNNTFTAGQRMKIGCDGGPGAAQTAMLIIQITQTA